MYLWNVNGARREKADFAGPRIIFPQYRCIEPPAIEIQKLDFGQFAKCGHAKLVKTLEPSATQPLRERVRYAQVKRSSVSQCARERSQLADAYIGDRSNAPEHAPRISGDGKAATAAEESDDFAPEEALGIRATDLWQRQYYSHTASCVDGMDQHRCYCIALQRAIVIM
jgi:hypothetical protein